VNQIALYPTPLDLPNKKYNTKSKFQRNPVTLEIM